MNEVWIHVIGYEGFYSVSDYCRVKSHDRMSKHWRGGLRRYVGQILNPTLNDGGYPFVRLSKDGKTKIKTVHHLVLEAFVGSCPENMEACHNDNNRANPRLDNLRWDTRSGNFADKVQNGTTQRGEQGSAAKLTDSQVLEIRRKLSIGITGVSLAEEYNVIPKTISRIKHRETWFHI